MKIIGNMSIFCDAANQCQTDIKKQRRHTKGVALIADKLHRHWRRSGAFIVNFEHVSNLALVFLFLTLNM